MTDKPSSDRPGSKHGDGPRKPKATFGDVMKGIPAGRPREEGNEGRREERSGGGGGGRSGGPGRSDASKDARPPQKRENREPSKEKDKGPSVVVMRKPVLAGPPGSEPVAAPPTPPPNLVYSRPVEEQAAETENFADLFAKSDGKGTRGVVRPGSKVTGVIIQIGQSAAFLTLQEGGEASIELRELTGEDESGPQPKVGDWVEGYVVSTGREGVIVTKGLGKNAGAAGLGRLQAALDGGIPIEGSVSGVNKGGLEVELGGGIRGFCPVSQIDVRFVENPAQFVGQKLQFKVTELKGSDVVLSRRALLEAERQAAAEKTRENLVVGARLKGKVTSLRDFGAFVDLGGIEGLIHVSELSHQRVGHPGDVLQVGQEVSVEVRKIDAADPSSPDKSKHRERVGLSLRALEADPWQTAAERFPLGSQVKGKVVRLQPFGAFVELAPGVDGLIHISNLSDKRINHPKEVVSEGQEVEVVVEKVEIDQQRIGLALWREGYVAPVDRVGAAPEANASATTATGEARPPPPRRASVGDVVEATVDKIEAFGLFVSFPGGRGLVPNVEMGTPFGTDHRKQFPAGTKFKALISEIDTQGRLRMSKVGAEQAEERAEVRKYLAETQPATKGKGFGTFADLLKAKLAPK